MDVTKLTNLASVTDHKEMQTDNLSDNKYKITVLGICMKFKKIEATLNELIKGNNRKIESQKTQRYK